MSDFAVDDFQTPQGVFLHSDLTADHFLVDRQTNRITGVIDFADSMTGHSEYDLAASFCYLFKDQKPAIASFFKVWGDEIEPERMMMWVILHRFSSLPRYFGDQRLRSAHSFSDLAREAFGYN